LPPAASQSALLVIVKSDLLSEEPRVDGLADGDVDESDEEEPDDGVDMEPLLDEPLLDPDPLLLLPGAPDLPPPAPPVCAAASAGTKQTIPIKTTESILFIRFPPFVG